MKFDYEDYKKQTEQRQERSQQGSSLQPVQFIGSLLKKSPELVVRFPYHTPKDFYIEHCHEVENEGSYYPTRVECTKDTGKCVLCENNVKEVDRFLVEAVAYIVENGKVSLVPVIWDKPATFANVLESKMIDYGDLADCLFKIKKSGTGLSTTYSVDYIANKALYNPEVYVKDFSVLEDIDVRKVFIKTMERYLSSLEERENVVEETETAAPEVTPTLRETTTDPYSRVSNTTDPTTSRPKRYTYN